MGSPAARDAGLAQGRDAAVAGGGRGQLAVLCCAGGLAGGAIRNCDGCADRRALFAGVAALSASGAGAAGFLGDHLEESRSDLVAPQVIVPEYCGVFITT